MARWRAGFAPACAVALVLAAVGLGAEASAAGEDRAPPPGVGPCELRRADRARTPAQSCLACHDGTAGAAVGFAAQGSGHGLSHPVEVDYLAAFARRPGRYVPPGAIRADVPLVDGRVSCTSCHDSASPHPKRAVDPVTLCHACHRL